MHRIILALALIGLPSCSAVAQVTSETPEPVVGQAPTAATAPVPSGPPGAELVPAPTNATAATALANPEAKIVMYRPSSIMGMGIACPIRHEGKEIVELARGKYAEWTVAAGHYVLTNKTSSVDVAVNPGETRYVRCIIKPGFLTGRADLQIADEASFNEHSKEFEKKTVE